MFMYELLGQIRIFAFGHIGMKASRMTCSWEKRKSSGGKNETESKGEKRNQAKKRGAYLTFQHCKLGTGVDLACAVSGCALVNGFVSVGAQWLDPQYRTRAIIKFNHLWEPQQSKKAINVIFSGPFSFSKHITLLHDTNKIHFDSTKTVFPTNYFSHFKRGC